MTRLLRATITVVAVVCLTTACTRREADVAPMDDATAEQIVARYAQEALEFSGWSGFSEYSHSPSPCVGRHGEDSDTIYAMQGAYQLLVPGPEQLPLIERVPKAGRPAATPSIRSAPSRPSKATSGPPTLPTGRRFS
jgi:hypothetical protein